MVINKKEFYFIRHGQTDHNLKGIVHADHIDIPINDHGRQQAAEIEALVSALPIKTVCCSPMKRAKETKEIVTTNLIANHYEIPALAECSGAVWLEMTSSGPGAHLRASGSVQTFIEQVKNGINQALSQPGPVLIVAHGGVHWAMCCLMEVDHEWVIGNCVPVHFTVINGSWNARKLI